MQIADDQRTCHNAQLVYLNYQDIALTLLTRFKIWLVHNCQLEEDHLIIKICTALLLYNACMLLNIIGILCVANNNKLKNHPRGMATFQKLILVLNLTLFLFFGSLNHYLKDISTQ